MNLEEFRKDIIKKTNLENYHTFMDVIEGWALTDMNIDDLKHIIGLKMQVNEADDLLDEHLLKEEGDEDEI